MTRSRGASKVSATGNGIAGTPTSLQVLGAWNGDATTVQVATVGATVSGREIRAGLLELAAAGVRRVLSPALPPASVRPWVEAGFEVFERLRLLRHDLTGIGAVAGSTSCQKVTGREWLRVAELDDLAFEPRWRLGPEGLQSALGATPSTRVRVTRSSEGLSGYAISGRAHHTGYVQRLAVHPAFRRQGLATTLLLDGLRWMRHGGASMALVNTPWDNLAAFTLYRSLGFECDPDGLVVLGSTTAGVT